MIRHIKSLLSTNLLLKIFSCVLGYALWSIISESHYVTMKFTAPVCFYNILEHMEIKAPETVEIALQGTRQMIKTVDTESLALHINAHDLSEGLNYLAIDTSTLFLPPSINVVHYTPSNVTVTMKYNA